MTDTSLIVRPLATSAEYQLQISLADQAFSHEPAPENEERWLRYLTGLPEFRSEQLRGAFLGDQQTGGYMLYEREMRMGSARLLTGCIGMVVTHPSYRQRGVATALMRDAIQFAQERNHTLLLLDGIPKFYYRYGYTDMLDLTTVDVDRAAILAQPSSAYTVRTATAEDAADLLRLYESQYGQYTGCFVRTVEQQAYRLSTRGSSDVVAIAPDGAIQGYLSGIDGIIGNEVAADNWEAQLALMQHHASLFNEAETPPKALQYRLPLQDRLVSWIHDHLEVPDTSQWQNPAEGWVLHSESYHHRHAGWMGRIANPHTLMSAIVPELQRRWQRGLASWQGQVALSIDGNVYTLHIDNRNISLTHSAHTISVDVQLTQQSLTQLVFGYRSAAQIMEASGQNVSDELLLVLSVLFPTGHAWLARSDWF